MSGQTPAPEQGYCNVAVAGGCEFSPVSAQVCYWKRMNFQGHSWKHACVLVGKTVDLERATGMFAGFKRVFQVSLETRAIKGLLQPERGVSTTSKSPLEPAQLPVPELRHSNYSLKSKLFLSTWYGTEFPTSDAAQYNSGAPLGYCVAW